MNERIYIVDDEKEIADLIAVYLQNDGYTVETFGDGASALARIEEQPPALAILDIMLPDMDGFQICGRIREHHFFPVIMLTARTEDTDKILGLTIGADDYITKPFNPLELIARVKTQLRRYVRYNPGESGAQSALQERTQGELQDGTPGRPRNGTPGALQQDAKDAPEAEPVEYDIHGLLINRETHKCILFGEEISLTPIEFSVLWYLCAHQGKVISSEELFEQVWGEPYIDNNNTVMTHIGRLREKLHEPPCKPRFVKTVWGVGYTIEK